MQVFKKRYTIDGDKVIGFTVDDTNIELIIPSDLKGLDLQIYIRGHVSNALWKKHNEKVTKVSLLVFDNLPKDED